MVYPVTFFFMLALLLVFGSVSSSSSSSPFNLLNNPVAAKSMTAGGGSGGNSGGDGGGDGDSGGDSGKKHKPKKQDTGGGGNSIKSLSSNSGKKDDSKKDDSGKKSKDKKEDGGRQTKAQKDYNKAINDIIDLNTETLATGGEQQQLLPPRMPTGPSTTPTETVVDESHPPQLPENYDSDPSYKKLAGGSIVRDHTTAYKKLPGGSIVRDDTLISPRVKDIYTTRWLPDKNGEWPDTVTREVKAMQLDENDNWKTLRGPDEKWTPADKDGSNWIYSSQDSTSDYTREPDNTQTWDFRDGRTRTELPDNTLIEKKPAPDAPGQFIVTTTLPDKSKTVKDPGPYGKETFLDANDNTQKIVFPQKDGTFNVYDPNAGTTVKTNTKPDR